MESSESGAAPHRFNFAAVVSVGLLLIVWQVASFFLAIELGNRVLVLGKPARLLMDLTISEQMKRNLTARDEMKTRILNVIEANRPVD